MEYEEFVDEGYEPGNEELVCYFYFEHVDEVEFEWAAGGIAAESSVGTWEPGLKTMNDSVKEHSATVFQLDEDNGRISVAYPPELFESGNLPQILSSITGNIYGLEEIERLRLLDVEFSEAVAGRFLGPQLGLKEVKKRAGAEERPLVGTIVKPKLGLTSEEHASVAYDSWKGGLDIVKDDENLASMQFNDFDKRVKNTLDAKKQAEEETGESKIYFPNITAPVAEMKRRAELVMDNDGSYVMIDILTAGWSAVQEMREYLEGRDIGIHAHRAQHAAYTRLKTHGISMLSIAKFARLVGVDNLHAGTVVGKMEGGKEEVQEIYSFLRSDWLEKKTTIPVASGGLHPGLVPDLVDLLGEDIVIQAGGGVHGHPGGSEAGGRALRAAADAVKEGKTLEEKAEEVEELQEALEKWGREET
ncbi:MAG: type III ribulose-bisphosphate carboxylase [Candidatus Nanohaloarchaeota archaeon QJJ-7]|nr:type III ribulose-bisphosphate carboxylase [Candidatus Nanohaloarchaeota archaeon QJJ-7]